MTSFYSEDHYVSVGDLFFYKTDQSRAILQTKYKDRLYKSIKGDLPDLKEWSHKLSLQVVLSVLPSEFDTLLNELKMKRDDADSEQAWLPMHPVHHKPIYQVSSAYCGENKDPSLDAKEGFRRDRDEYDPMIITCDFGAVTRMNEVILKKYNHQNFKE